MHTDKDDDGKSSPDAASQRAGKRWEPGTRHGRKNIPEFPTERILPVGSDAGRHVTAANHR